MLSCCWEVKLEPCCVMVKLETKFAGPGQLTWLLQLEVVASDVQIRAGNEDESELQEGPLQVRIKEAGIP